VCSFQLNFLHGGEKKRKAESRSSAEKNTLDISLLLFLFPVHYVLFFTMTAHNWKMLRCYIYRFVTNTPIVVRIPVIIRVALRVTRVYNKIDPS